MNSDPITIIRAYVALASPFIALLLLCYVIYAVSVALFGSREKRRTRLQRASLVSSAVVISAVGAWCAVDYFWHVALRRTAHACETHVSDGGKYTVTLCLLNARHDYLRLYESSTARLVADRTYNCEPSEVQVRLDDDMVYDRCAYAESSIKLPPSLLDRVLAKLP